MKAFACTGGGGYTCGGFGVSFAPKNACRVWFGWGLGLGQVHAFCRLRSAIQVFEFWWVSRFLFPAVPTWTFNPHSGHGSELSAVNPPPCGLHEQHYSMLGLKRWIRRWMTSIITFSSSASC